MNEGLRAEARLNAWKRSTKHKHLKSIDRGINTRVSRPRTLKSVMLHSEYAHTLCRFLRLLRVEWQPADHNLPRHDDRRRHAQCQGGERGGGRTRRGARFLRDAHAPARPRRRLLLARRGAHHGRRTASRAAIDRTTQRSARHGRIAGRGKGRAGIATRMAEPWRSRR